MDRYSSTVAMKVKVAACQQALHEPVSTTAIERLITFPADFVCLPEHYPLAKEIADLNQAAEKFEQRKEYLRTLSRKLPAAVIGGTLTERVADGFYNTCYVFDQGTEIGFYRKVNPTAGEIARGVLSGSEFKIFELRGLKIGVLICADVLNLRSFDELSSLDCQLTFIPTASPYREGESVEAKFQRDRSIFLEGAKMLGCPVVKTCGVGTTFGHRIQGRSLIATPQKIVARAEPDQEDQSLLLLAELQI
jgi:predicted amidohydrolase